MSKALATLAEPWPLKVVLDNVLKSKGGHGWLNQLIFSAAGTDKIAILKFAALAVLVIAAVGALSSYTEKYITTNLGQWVMHDLRHTLYSHIQRLSLGFHDQKQTGDLISRLTSDIDAIQGFITSGLLGVLMNSLTLVGMVAVMFCLSWRFTLIALSVAPLLFAVVFHYTRRIKKATREVRKKEGEMVSVIQEVLVLHARGEGVRPRRVRTAAHGGGEPGIGGDRDAGSRAEGQAFPDGGYDHRGGNLPGAVVWRANGVDRSAQRRFAGALRLVSRQDVQADARTFEDDRRVLEGRGGLRADPRGAGYGPRGTGPAGRAARTRVPRQDRTERCQFRLRAELLRCSSRSA